MNRREPAKIIELAEDIADRALWDIMVRRPMEQITAGQGEKQPKVVTDE